MEPEFPVEAMGVFVAGLNHPESLAFDARGELWIGCESGQICRVSPEKAVTPVAHLGACCHGMAFSPKDELLVSIPGAIARVAANGEVSAFVSQLPVGVRHGVFDSAGTYYVAASGHWKKRNGIILRIRAGERANVAESLGYVNGIALSADGNTLYVAESDTNSILRLAVGPDGALGAPELWVRDCGRFPTGLALDSERGLYVSCYASDEIWRISPTGEKRLVAFDPWSWQLSGPGALAFGGVESAELYICNLAKTHVTRIAIGRSGQALVNRRMARKFRPRPAPL